jgi:hypothetical protein
VKIDGPSIFTPDHSVSLNLTSLVLTCVIADNSVSLSFIPFHSSSLLLTLLHSTSLPLTPFHQVKSYDKE